jgi:vancomycin resistance protein VanJ
MKKLNWVTHVILIYTVGLAIWFGFWRWTGDHFWWMAILNRIAPYLFIPVLLLAVLAVIRRNYRTLVVLLFPVIIFAGLYWPYVVPQGMQKSHPLVLKVMTYNILYSNTDYDRTANVVRRYQPDLVALQEVQPATMTALQTRLRDLYPYSLMGTPNPYGTTAVFSRYAFIDSYTLDLTVDRPAVVVHVNVNGSTVTFLSAHLAAFNLQQVPLLDIPNVTRQRTHDQNLQATLLIEKIARETGNVILGCDCNSKETSRSYQILSQALANAARKVGWVFGASLLTGVKQDRDLQHIDYIFYKGEQLQPVGVYAVQDSGGSDHLPVLAIVETLK